MKNQDNQQTENNLQLMNAARTYPSWLDQAIFYQVYPQSFYDTNGDGIGDIPGIIQKLDYLQWLGINAIWINPCFVSPFQDAGYDIADYFRIAPRYGTNHDLFRLCREAHRQLNNLPVVHQSSITQHSFRRLSLAPLVFPNSGHNTPVSPILERTNLSIHQDHLLTHVSPGCNGCSRYGVPNPPHPE